MQTSKRFLTEAEILAEIESYAPALTAGELLRIGKAQGWEEDLSRGKGSHRALLRNGYRAIILKCHGLNTEQTRQATRKYLNDIYQPALDVVREEAQKQAALQDFINQLSLTINDCRENFLTKSHLLLQQVEEQVRQYETQRLAESEQSINELIDDEKNRQIHEQKQALLETERSLSLTKAQVIHLEKELVEQRQQFNTQTSQLEVQQQEIQSLTQNLAKTQAFLAQQTEELSQSRSKLAHYRHQQRRQTFVTLAGAGALLAILVFVLLRSSELLPFGR